MLYLHCPFCGEKRDEQEFHYAGEAFIVRPKNPEELSDEEWGDYVFMRSNHKGWIWEQWEHTSGCRKLFVVKRHNVTNEVEGSYTFAEARKASEKQSAAEESV
ncbi:MAG: sarcosine oxidase subunit delta [Neisseria sp.]|uniref:sarcosine oxidase subunit delta n=1 Tax=Neisseria sp. TaxID=192066 RepID=UPI0026DB440E|nr:sarcosine oxidase subunit delta [Neisseria sp.]MDO4248739.1 sarcosine oxidase subunit delta [Neisseria sp.]